VQNLTLILQVIALVCFFISWMNWQIPKSPRPAWYWLGGGLFWLLLSFMLSGLAVSLHQVSR
jgi:predicted ABC-type exoprotein transport system permease subunit